MNLEITAHLIKNLEELANNKELSDAHEKADRILLEFAPDEIKNGWQKVTKVRIEERHATTLTVIIVISFLLASLAQSFIDVKY